MRYSVRPSDKGPSASLRYTQTSRLVGDRSHPRSLSRLTAGRSTPGLSSSRARTTISRYCLIICQPYSLVLPPPHTPSLRVWPRGEFLCNLRQYSSSTYFFHIVKVVFSFYRIVVCIVRSCCVSFLMAPISETTNRSLSFTQRTAVTDHSSASWRPLDPATLSAS